MFQEKYSALIALINLIWSTHVHVWKPDLFRLQFNNVHQLYSERMHLFGALIHFCWNADKKMMQPEVFIYMKSIKSGLQQPKRSICLYCRSTPCWENAREIIHHNLTCVCAVQQEQLYSVGNLSATGVSEVSAARILAGPSSHVSNCWILLPFVFSDPWTCPQLDQDSKTCFVRSRQGTVLSGFQNNTRKRFLGFYLHAHSCLCSSFHVHCTFLHYFARNHAPTVAWDTSAVMFILCKYITQMFHQIIWSEQKQRKSTNMYTFCFCSWSHEETEKNDEKVKIPGQFPFLSVTFVNFLHNTPDVQHVSTYKCCVDVEKIFLQEKLERLLCWRSHISGGEREENLSRKEWSAKESLEFVAFCCTGTSFKEHVL